MTEATTDLRHPLAQAIYEEVNQAQNDLNVAKSAAFDAEQRIRKLEADYRRSICTYMWDQMEAEGLGWCRISNLPFRGHLVDMAELDIYLTNECRPNQSRKYEVRYLCGEHLTEAERRLTMDNAKFLIREGIPKYAAPVMDMRRPITDPVMIPADLKERFSLPHWELFSELG